MCIRDRFVNLHKVKIAPVRIAQLAITMVYVIFASHVLIVQTIVPLIVIIMVFANPCCVKNVASAPIVRKAVIIMVYVRSLVKIAGHAVIALSVTLTVFVSQISAKTV